MDFSLSETERMVVEAARQAVDWSILPLVGAEPPDRPLSKEAMLACYRHVAELGYFGARVPGEDGGSGLTHVMLGLITEVLPPFLALSCVSHEATTCRVYQGATRTIWERYGAELVSGAAIAATAVSEPEAGSDPRSVRTTATPSGDGYRIRGSKLWTTNGTIADLVLAVARLEPGGELARLLVDTRETPVEAREVPVTGLRRGHLSELHLDLEVPREHLLGERGDTRAVMTASWLVNRPNIGLMACHLARRALDAAIAHAKERHQFGRPIGSFQLVQALIAEMATELAASRLLCYQALFSLDQGRPSAEDASMAKMFATEAALRVILKAQQVHGALGITSELPLDEWLRDARMLSYPDGTTQIHQLIVGRALLGMRAFS